MLLQDNESWEGEREEEKAQQQQEKQQEERNRRAIELIEVETFLPWQQLIYTK